MKDKKLEAAMLEAEQKFYKLYPKCAPKAKAPKAKPEKQYQWSGMPRLSRGPHFKEGRGRLS